MTLLSVSLFLIDLGMNFILCECSEIRRPESQYRYVPERLVIHHLKIR